MLNIVAFWLYYERTKRLLFRYRDAVNDKVNEVFIRIESRLRNSVPDFEDISGVAVWAVMFTYDRKEMALRTLESLRKHEPDLPILVIDNGSTDGTPEALTERLTKGSIQKLLLNTHSDVPQWQKSYALKQGLKLLAMERPRYLVWLDDDLEITRPCVRDACSLLELLKEQRVKVINLTDDDKEEQNHPTLKWVTVTLPSGTNEVKIRATFNGAFNLFSVDFFREIGYPPINEGINDWGVEDWFYSRGLQTHDYRSAVLVAAKHVGGDSSKRAEMEKRK